MRISQLASVAGVSVATIKYYVREGILPAGDARTARSADYGELHLRRLRFIRALRETADLPMSSIKSLIAKIEDPAGGIHELFGEVQVAVSRSDLRPATTDTAAADDVIDALGWHVNRAAPVFTTFAATLASAHELGLPVDVESLKPYAGTAMLIARTEMGTLPPGDPSRDEVLEYVVIGIVLFDRVLSQLRLLAQESVSAELFGGAPRVDTELPAGEPSARAD